jgi:hypothetical protein
MIANRHIIDVDKVSGLNLGQIATAVAGAIKTAPRLGDLTVRELACMSVTGEDPVGIYIFGDETGNILYLGKTHGRSLHERMVSHLDSREPIVGSPHLAQFVSSQVKLDPDITRSEAVENILDMRMLWLPIPKGSTSTPEYKKKVALAERKLLWRNSLNPRFNSPRVKTNDSITVAGERYDLEETMPLFSACK